MAEGLHYDWTQVSGNLVFVFYASLLKQPMVDAHFNLPSGLCHRELNITWDNYQVKILQNFTCVVTMHCYVYKI